MAAKVVLMDRDGTVLVEPTDFSVRLKGLHMFPETLEAMAKLAEVGYSVIFVTNQLSIAKGNLSLKEYEATNNKMIELLEPTGIKVLKVYTCPHGQDDNCVCRKPKPGMLLQAIKEFNLNPGETFMIGDRVTDIEAGMAAGAKTILVPQGNFKETSAKAKHIAGNLLEAAEYIIAN